MRTEAINAITNRLIHGDDYSTWVSWCAAQPRMLCSAIMANKGEEYFAARIPVAPAHESDTLVVKLRVERDGVFINSCHKAEPCDAAVTHLKLLQQIWPGVVICRLVCLCLDRTLELLERWEGQATVGVEEFYTNNLSHLLLTYSRRAESVPSCLVTTKRLELLSNNASDCLLRGIDCFTHLEELCVRGQPVCSLTLLASLHTLAVVDISLSAIHNDGIRVLATLPSLRELIMAQCEHVTNINPLGSSDSLSRLCASTCPKLHHHFSDIASAPNLQSLDLSYNLMREDEFARLLEQPMPLRQGTFIDTYFPSFPPSLPGALAFAHVRILSLIGAHVPFIQWLCAAVLLHELILDRSSITNGQLVELSKHLLRLQTLFLRNCQLLLTSLEFAKDWRSLTLLQVSRKSLAQPNILEWLQREGVAIYVS